MVTNLINENGRAVANQFVIAEGNTIVFQSYQSKVCKIEQGKVITFGSAWDYSRTTMKHLKSFLAQNGFYFKSAKDIAKAIKDGVMGEIKVVLDETM